MQRVRRLEEWVNEVGEVTAIRVIFHDEWQVIRPALISFHSSRGIRSTSGNVSLPESFNFHFFKTKVSLRPVGISSRHTLSPLSALHSRQSCSTLSNLKYSFDCFSCRLWVLIKLNWEWGRGWRKEFGLFRELCEVSSHDIWLEIWKGGD